jgi:hypothetical protein
MHVVLVLYNKYFEKCTSIILDTHGSNGCRHLDYQTPMYFSCEKRTVSNDTIDLFFGRAHSYLEDTDSHLLSAV